MKRTLLLLFVLVPYVVDAKEFVADRPTTDQIVRAITNASDKTRVHSALLYGLFSLETSFGNDLGKTESGWNDLCRSKNTENCRKWKKYDCKGTYANARHFDEILKALGWERKNVPTSSTCALGFAQFEPNTWHELTSRRKDKVYNPWSTDDAMLIAAYHLKGLGAKSQKTLSGNEVIDADDRMALKKYYCGGRYWLQECDDYALRVELRARNAYEELLRRDLERQIRILEEKKELGGYEIMQCPAVSTLDFEFGTAPNPVRSEELKNLMEDSTRELLDTHHRYQNTRSNGLIPLLQNQARKRKEYLVEAFYRNPDSAIFSIIFEDDRAGISRFTRDCLERPETLEGMMEVLHIDFEDSASQSQYSLLTDDGVSIILHPALGLRMALESGIRVRAKGIRVDNELLFNGSRSLNEVGDHTGGIDVLSEPQ